MKKFFIAAALILGISGGLYAQHLPLNNQYLVNRFSLSPSYAGTDDDVMAFLGYRKQWVDFKGSPVTKMIYLDGKIIDDRVGMGGAIISDQTDIFNYFYAELSYAYHLALNEEHTLSFGLTGKIYENNIDLSRIKAADQNDPVFENKQLFNGTEFNAGASILYQFLGLDVGFSVPFIIENKAKYYLNNSVENKLISRHYVAHASYDFDIQEKWQLTPYFVSRWTEMSPLNYDIALLAKYMHKYWLGLTYRKNSEMGVHFGLKLSNSLLMNYTYEFAAGGDGVLSHSEGNHEFALGININRVVEKEPVKEPIVTPPVDTTKKVKEEVVQKEKEVNEELLKEIKMLHDRLVDIEMELGNLKAAYDQLEQQQVDNTEKIEQKEEFVRKEKELKEEMQDIQGQLNKLSEGYYVVIESFKYRENAKRAQKIWKDRGYEASIVYNDDRDWYYIFLNRYNSYMEASQKRNELTTKGIDSWIFISPKKTR
jgi:type IX secretion system PorP/SprF family membrane protein